MIQDQKVSLEGYAHSAEIERIYVRQIYPTHADGILLTEYWQERERDGGFVVGRDIPARRLARVLHNVMVNEPTSTGEDFYIRLAGETWRRRFGREVTGLLFSELFDRATCEHLVASAIESLRMNVPLVLDARVMQSGIGRDHYEVVRLPVWAPDKAARWSLVGAFYFE